jgi:hypothetical protein
MVLMDMSTFRITYDGPALESSEMDVRELAPALLAIGDLLDAATIALYGDQIKPQINVKGSFKTGSFGIDFNLATSLLSKVRDIFAGDNTTAVVNSLAILGALGFANKVAIKPGLFAVLKWLRGRKIERVETSTDSATLFVDGDQLTIELNVLALLRDVSVRNITSKVLEPLSREGIDTFAAGTDNEIVETVSAAEASWFIAPATSDELLLDDVRKMAFSIVSLAFKEGNKWRLCDGAATINASITDAEFLSKVEHNQIAFAKGDILICDVRVLQWQIQSGAKNDYEVIRVKEHRTSARQIPLPGI